MVLSPWAQLQMSDVEMAIKMGRELGQNVLEVRHRNKEKNNNNNIKMIIRSESFCVHLQCRVLSHFRIAVATPTYNFIEALSTE